MQAHATYTILLLNFYYLLSDEFYRLPAGCRYIRVWGKRVTFMNFFGHFIDFYMCGCESVVNISSDFHKVYPIGIGVKNPSIL